ncbi:MAG: class I SAM-dependent methyltransferase [Chloroflexi bacterium]|nr:class I SAM-dependent methyltransferase [Chloroflexota bacterium]
MKPRIVQTESTFCRKEWVDQYDEIARRSMTPLFRHFARGVRKAGLARGWILEIGSGSGRLFLALAAGKSTDFKFVGIDVSRGMARKALENTREAGVPVHFPQASGGNLPFRDSCIDLVISTSSLHMWSDPVGVLNEVYRVLKPGGTCLIRDGRRLPENWFWRLFVWASSRIRGMDGRQRKAWQGAIAAGYTVAEARELLGRSHLQDWSVGTDRVLFELVIEARK